MKNKNLFSLITCISRCNMLEYIKKEDFLMGLFSFLFGKKKVKKEEVELKKITTFEIVENSPRQKNDLAEKKSITVIETTEAIDEEKNGEKSAKNITAQVEENKELHDSTSDKSHTVTAKTSPIEISEEIQKSTENTKQNSFVKESNAKKVTPKKVSTHIKTEEVPQVSIEETQETPHNQRVGKFEIKKTKDGRFVFNLYASNHVIVATSQIYSSSQSALNGIKSIIANAEKSPIEDTTLKAFDTLSYPKWEIYLDKAEHFRFRLYASNGSCVVHSQGYTSKANCKKGIESIMKCAPTAEIDKSYLKKPE